MLIIPHFEINCGKLYFINICLDGDTNHKNSSSQRKSHFLNHENEKHKISNPVYSDGSKRPDKKVGCAAVFQSETVYGALEWNTSVYESELQGILVAIQQIKYRMGACWTIYTDSLNAIWSIKKQRSDQPLVQQVLTGLTELHHMGKVITICKVPAHVGVSGNEKADIAAQEAAKYFSPGEWRVKQHGE